MTREVCDPLRVKTFRPPREWEDFFFAVSEPRFKAELFLLLSCTRKKQEGGYQLACGRASPGVEGGDRAVVVRRRLPRLLEATRLAAWPPGRERAPGFAAAGCSEDRGENQRSSWMPHKRKCDLGSLKFVNC